MADQSPTPGVAGVNAAQADEARHESNQDKWSPKSLKALEINGATPFWFHGDGVHSRLAEAHALLTILAGTYRDAHEYRDLSKVEISLITFNDEIKHQALHGVATLIALARHHYDHVSQADREERS
ncbi:hypothetical protein U8326_10075 [Tsuneonella sp. CC-YZS046]|uniref:hypothetical protein n=1 Tax=Tsuneonella sp. CC-YZS046 TaxID=3042152 RepID=UPI002D79FE96|nr:hypothetical protein [Tsuneonella sp. CC-YZS046]WRO65408.1 hypothetical protein U8326_10075 [Tsuneonella sp. CC-YZS046]